MKTTSYFFLVLILLFTIISTNSNPVSIVHAQTATGTRIDIGILPNSNEYNVSYLELDKNTTYTIYFWNAYPAAYNMVIAVSGRNVTATTLYNNTDLVIGPTSYANTSDYGAPGKFWSTNWTTPNNDTYIIYFCPFPDRFPATLGIFVIGSPNYLPPIQIPSEGPSSARELITYLLVGSIILVGSVLILICLISYIKFKRLPSKTLIAFFLVVIALELIFLILVDNYAILPHYF